MGFEATDKKDKSETGRKAMNQNKKYRCSRCGGLMIQTFFFERIIFTFGWKCCNCGEHIDDQILQNRILQAMAIQNELEPATA